MTQEQEPTFCLSETALGTEAKAREHADKLAGLGIWAVETSARLWRKVSDYSATSNWRADSQHRHYKPTASALNKVCMHHYESAEGC